MPKAYHLLSLGCKDARPKKRSTSRQFAIQGFSRQRAQAQSWGRGEHQARHLAVLRIPLGWTLWKSPVLCRLAPGLIIVELRAGQTCTYVPGSHTRVLWIGAGPPETPLSILRLLSAYFSFSNPGTSACCPASLWFGAMLCTLHCQPSIIRPVTHGCFRITWFSGYFSLRTSILAYFLLVTK